MEGELAIFNSSTSSAVPTIPEFTMKTGIFLLIALLVRLGQNRPSTEETSDITEEPIDGKGEESGG